MLECTPTALCFHPICFCSKLSTTDAWTHLLCYIIWPTVSMLSSSDHGTLAYRLTLKSSRESTASAVTPYGQNIRASFHKFKGNNIMKKALWYKDIGSWRPRASLSLSKPRMNERNSQLTVYLSVALLVDEPDSSSLTSKRKRVRKNTRSYNSTNVMKALLSIDMHFFL